MQIWGKRWSLNNNILRQKSGLRSFKTGGLLMQVKIIAITLGRIWKWSLNTGGLLVEVVFRSGLTVLSHVSVTYYGCQKYLYYGKNSNLSFLGGCYTPLTRAAIDRTLTTMILVSFPNETSSVLRWSYWKKLPALGGRRVSCHISIQGIKLRGFTLLLSTTTQLRAILSQ